MQLTERQLQKYMEIYRKTFGIEVSREKALAEGMKLVSLVQLVMANADSSDKQTPIIT